MFALKGIREASGYPPRAGDRRGGGHIWADINWEQSGQISSDISIDISLDIWSNRFRFYRM